MKKCLITLNSMYNVFLLQNMFTKIKNPTPDIILTH